MAKLDLLAGYAIAFGLLAALQATVVCLVGFLALGLDAAHGAWLVGLLAIANALLGMALGLFVSAFARTEFQAVQFMPAIHLPAAAALRPVHRAQRNGHAPLLALVGPAAHVRL